MTQKHTPTRGILLAILPLLLLVGSCATVPLGLLPKTASEAEKKAELLFINGEFEKAVHIINDIT